MHTRFFNFIVLFAFSFNLVFASTHRISHIESRMISLQDGDEIVLDKMPLGWGVGRIVIEVNSISGKELSGKFVVNNCVHRLQGYYNQVEIDFGEL